MFIHPAFPSPCCTPQLSACPHRELFHPSDHFCGPPLDAFQQLHVSPVLSTPHLNAALQVRSHSTEQKGRSPPSALLAVLHWMHPGSSWLSGLRGRSPGSCPGAIHWATTWQPPQALFGRSLLHPYIPQIVLVVRVATTQVLDLAVSFVEHLVVLLGPLLSLSGSLWMASCPSGMLTASHSSVSSANTWSSVRSPSPRWICELAALAHGQYLIKDCVWLRLWDCINEIKQACLHSTGLKKRIMFTSRPQSSFHLPQHYFKRKITSWVLLPPWKKTNHVQSSWYKNTTISHTGNEGYHLFCDLSQSCIEVALVYVSVAC